jgi:hypothetical protein
LLFLALSAESFVMPRPRAGGAIRTLKASDDGWNEETFAVDNKTEDNMKLLKSLQENPSATSPPEKERDLFIPIFTLVSIAGFTGAYGYEMLRLYSRGELYLPF